MVKDARGRKKEEGSEGKENLCVGVCVWGGGVDRRVKEIGSPDGASLPPTLTFFVIGCGWRGLV